jgi:transposase
MYLKEIVQKNKNGGIRKYLHVVESVRINGKPRQRLLANLGRCDQGAHNRLEKMAEVLVSASEKLSLLNIEKDLFNEGSPSWGPNLIFKRLWEELGLEEVFKDNFSDNNCEFNITESLYNLVLNRLTAPSSKRHMESWQEDVHGLENFDLHQYYRAMDYMISNKDKVEEDVFFRMRDLLNQKVDFVLFDTTSLVYYGDGRETEELLKHGFSKARRGDLKQVVVGVLMSKCGIPLGHEVYSGNTTDGKCFKSIIDKVALRFKIENIILVGDRGMINQKNIQHLKDNKYKYILGYRMRTLKKEKSAQILEKADLRSMRKIKLQFKNIEYEGQRLIVYYNEERAQLDKQAREELLSKIKETIKSGKINSIVSNPSYKKYLRIKGEAPKIDLEKVERDALYDGVFVLTTNTELKPLAVVESYRDLWHIELGFKQLKSEIEMGPMYHYTDRRIRAHIMICFLALILRSHLYKKLQEEEKEISYKKMMSHLKALRVTQLKIKNKEVILRSELKPLANTAFRAIGMRVPSRIVSADPINNVVIRQS